MKGRRKPVERPIAGNITLIPSNGPRVTTEYCAGDIFALVERLRAACNYIKLEISGARVPRNFTVTFRDYETGNETTTQGTFCNGVSVAMIPPEVMKTQGQKCATIRDARGAILSTMFFNIEL